MSDGRNLNWWQGALAELNGTLGVLISHDCDIAASSSVEPMIEWIPAVPSSTDGSKTYGKNPRILELSCGANSGSEICLHFDVRSKLNVDKNDFLQNAVLFEQQFSADRLVILRRWLSSRYGRSAFPDAFESAMDRVRSKVDELSKKSGGGIRALYFDVDDGHMTERTSENDPYELLIYVVYPPETPTKIAEEFATKLKTIFTNRFKSSGEWKRVELVSCDAICEDNFSLLLANSTKTWRVDHRSLADPGAAVPDPDR